MVDVWPRGAKVAQRRLFLAVLFPRHVLVVCLVLPDCPGDEGLQLLCLVFVHGVMGIRIDEKLFHDGLMSPSGRDSSLLSSL